MGTAGGLEGYHVLKKGKGLTSFSPQALVDCDRQDAGCNGGDLPSALTYTKNNGLPTLSSYPYTGKDGKCKSFSASVKNKSMKHVKKDSPNSLKTALSEGPVSVCIEADKNVF